MTLIRSVPRHRVGRARLSPSPALRSSVAEHSSFQRVAAVNAEPHNSALHRTPTRALLPSKTYTLIVCGSEPVSARSVRRHMLERGVFVTTNRFEVDTPQDHFINDRCFGEDFAKWLRDPLAASASVSEPIQEDWGWVLLSKFHNITFTVTIGVMDAFIGEHPAEWRIGVAYERSQNLRRVFQRAPEQPFEEFVGIVRRILESQGDMRVSDTESDA